MPDGLEIDLVLRAINDPIRRSIIDLLSDGESRSLFSVCVELGQNHDIHISRQAMTKHLNVLESARLVEIQWKGRTKLHSLDTRPIKALGKGWLKQYLK